MQERKKNESSIFINLEDSFSLVSEFLAAKGLSNTLTTFQQEIQKLYIDRETITRLINFFKEGNHNEFFKVFEEIRKDIVSSDFLLLEFHIKIYFAVFHFSSKNKNGKRTEEMALFQMYLAERGQEIADNPELTPLFALPFVKDPSQHPVFSSFFTKEWRKSLEMKLLETLNSSIKPTQVSTLEKLNSLAQIPNSVSSSAMASAEILKRWKRFSKEVTELAREILDSVTSLKIDQNQSDTFLHNFQTYITRLEGYEGFLEDEINPSRVTNKEIASNSSFGVLDLQSLRDCLLETGDIAKVCALLQAIRWRISRSNSSVQRREAVIQITSTGLLNKSLIHGLLNRKSNSVNEHLISLLNVLTTEYIGRTFIVENKEIVEQLIKIMKGEAKDSFIRKNCLGAIQKLSLRRSCQDYLIEEDIVKWCVTTACNEKDSLSDYSILYLCALVLNLSMRSKGKNKFEECKHSTVIYLLDYLDYDFREVGDYVSGTLYYLLGRPSIKELAMKMGIEQRIRDIIKNDSKYAHSYNYVLEQLNENKSEFEENLSEVNEEDNDADLINQDDCCDEDSEEEAPEVTFDRRGEDLLKEFKLEGEEARNQYQVISAILEETITQSKQ